MFVLDQASFKLMFSLLSLLPVEDLFNDIIEALLAELCLVLRDLHLVVGLRVAPHPLQGKCLATHFADRPAAVDGVIAESVALQVLGMPLHVGKEVIFVDII